MRKLIIAILSIAQFGTIRLQAQSFDEKNFVFYSTRDGLSDNRIMGITQDKYGYLWVATQKGLNRFDGNNFLHFYSDSSRNSLPNDYIRQLKWTGKEHLAATTATGLHIVDPTTLEQRNIIVPGGPLNQPYIENNLYGVAGDTAGNIFLLSSAGFYHFNHEGKLIFRYDHYKKEDAGKTNVPFGRSDGIIAPEPGVLLLATTAGPYIYYIGRKELHSLNENDDALYRQTAPPAGRIHFMHSNNSSFSVIQEGARELAWFDMRQKKKFPINTTLTGLDKLFDWRTKITRLNDSTYLMTAMQKGFYLLHVNSQSGGFTVLPELYLPNYLCTSVLVDKNGSLWIGTDRGLLHQKKNAGSLEKMIIPAGMNPVGRSLRIYMVAIANKKIFVASAGGGVYAFDRDNLQPVKRIDFLKYSKTANNVFNLLAIGDSIYAGTFGPMIGIDARSYAHQMINLPGWDMEHDWVSWQFLDAAKTWYVSTNKNNVFYCRRFNGKGFTFEDYAAEPLFNILTPMYMTGDMQGNIWFGGHGISRFNVRTQQFDLLIDSFPKIKTARKEINGIEFDKNGKMYLALVENGLAIYDPVKKTFEHITRSHGLPDNTIRALYLHGNKLWLGTESGLAYYDITSKQISSFGLSDDMPEGAFTAYNFYYDSARHHLYGGFNNTVIRFDPDSLIKNNSPPAFFIENINVAGKTIVHHPAGQIELSYKNNNLVVNLAAINFEDGHQQLFAYRFVKNGRLPVGESDEPWQETGSQRSIIFSNLSPGSHRLQVKVFIKNNSWPEQIKEIEITIRPPFWQTKWFLLLAAAIFLSTFYFLYRWRIHIVRQKARIDHQLAELEMKGLHAQMNPHFIFNALNSIKEMILEDEKQNASRYLSKFAQLIRTNLEQSRQTVVSVQQCIDHLQQYLEMEKIRFEDFSYSIEVDDDLDTESVHMPPMLVQPLVENAIWHGLRNKEGQKKLKIRFLKKESQLLCEIEDNGIGYLQSVKSKSVLRPAYRSLGIANIREKLAVLNEKYKLNCSLQVLDKGELKDADESGTLAILKLNL